MVLQHVPYLSALICIVTDVTIVNSDNMLAFITNLHSEDYIVNDIIYSMFVYLVILSHFNLNIIHNLLYVRAQLLKMEELSQRDICKIYSYLNLTLTTRIFNQGHN